MNDARTQAGTKKRTENGAVQGVWSTTHTLFLGEYTHKVDPKGRLALPAKFRATLQKEGAIVTKGNEHCLYMFTTEFWKTFAETLGSLSPLTSKVARDAQRTLLAGATAVTPDRQGRILLPSHLREYAGLTSSEGTADAVVAGLYNRVEIWPAAKWRTQREETDLDELGPDLAALGI